MSHKHLPTGINQDYFLVEKNQDLALRLFRSYYRAHQNTGKLFDDVPDFFLVDPAVLNGAELTTRASDKLILDDCIHRAQERQGFVGVSKRKNPKLNYYWLELTVLPFMLGDSVTENNRSEFFYLLSNFIEYTKQHPKAYGDITAEIDSDKDLALMLKEINKQGDGLKVLLASYAQERLVRFNANWPISEVNKLLMTLKDNDQSWCDVFFEYLIYVMGRKGKGGG
ncbi:hypothetical protein GALL_72840 [mine drainage metagenome]|uniref:Uncharacterized protein n=1 Tax=mine drainage metagenome TaxID=410659 RepID=A0A1J5SSY8_9ZZZZ